MVTSQDILDKIVEQIVKKVMLENTDLKDKTLQYGVETRATQIPKRLPEGQVGFYLGQSSGKEPVFYSTSADLLKLVADELASEYLLQTSAGQPHPVTNSSSRPACAKFSITNNQWAALLSTLGFKTDPFLGANPANSSHMTRTQTELGSNSFVSVKLGPAPAPAKAGYGVAGTASFQTNPSGRAAKETDPLLVEAKEEADTGCFRSCAIS